jgi:hypothetical protein
MRFININNILTVLNHHYRNIKFVTWGMSIMWEGCHAEALEACGWGYA